MLIFMLLISTLAVILGVLLLSVYLGVIFAKRQIKTHPKHKLEILTVAENSVFALLALLMAFTFSGAFDRYEARKERILQQADAFEKTLRYLDVVQPKYREILKPQIVKYMNLHLDAYHAIPYMDIVKHALDQASIIEDQIWQTTVIAGYTDPNESLGQSFIDVVSALFEQAHNGINMTKMHAPAIIFYLMLGLAALGAFMIGYDSAENKQKQPLHIAFYVLLTGATIFIILNLEFPRIGFIHSGTFDQLIVDVRDHTNKFAEHLSL